MTNESANVSKNTKTTDIIPTTQTNPDQAPRAFFAFNAPTIKTKEPTPGPSNDDQPRVAKIGSAVTNYFKEHAEIAKSAVVRSLPAKVRDEYARKVTEGKLNENKLKRKEKEKKKEEEKEEQGKQPDLEKEKEKEEETVIETDQPVEVSDVLPPTYSELPEKKVNTHVRFDEDGHIEAGESSDSDSESSSESSSEEEDQLADSSDPTKDAISGRPSMEVERVSTSAPANNNSQPTLHGKNYKSNSIQPTNKKRKDTSDSRTANPSKKNRSDSSSSNQSSDHRLFSSGVPRGHTFVPNFYFRDHAVNKPYFDAYFKCLSIFSSIIQVPITQIHSEAVNSTDDEKEREAIAVVKLIELTGVVVKACAEVLKGRKPEE